MPADSTAVLIRSISASDIESMVDCVNAVFSERLYLAYVSSQPRADSVAYFKSGLADGYPRIVAVDGDVVAGWCDVNPTASSRVVAQQHIGRLGMGLLPEYRGKGHGAALLRTCVEACRGKWDRIELSVYSHNQSAIALYKKCGFVEEGRKREAWKLDGKVSDVVEMGLLLK